MSEIQLFDVEGHPWRWGATADGRPYAVAADVAKSFDYATAKDATRQLDGDEKGRQILPTPGGPQEMTVIYEDGLWELIFLSRKPEAKAIKKRVKAILREIRETGRYQVEPLDELALAERNVELIKEKRALAERAALAERRAAEGASFKSAIEAGDGLTIRAFHKKYFSDVPERAFFDHLYAKGYLIDQRGKGAIRSDGTRGDGAEHRHPAYKGKHFFYLHGNGIHGGKRREGTRVRPGQVELELKAKLIADGLAANNNATGQLALLGDGAA